MSGPTRGFFGRRRSEHAAAGVPANRIRVERFGPTG
jgi:hypothetical protein